MKKMGFSELMENSCKLSTNDKPIEDPTNETVNQVSLIGSLSVIIAIGTLVPPLKTFTSAGSTNRALRFITRILNKGSSVYYLA